jgi:hypothetical protein
VRQLRYWSGSDVGYGKLATCCAAELVLWSKQSAATCTHPMADQAEPPDVHASLAYAAPNVAVSCSVRLLK